MANGAAVQLPPGYEDATPVAGPMAAQSVSLPPGYEDATPVKGPLASTAGEVGQVASDVATGFGKGIGDTVSGVSHLLNKIPGVGETLAPKAGISALDAVDVPQSDAEAAGKGLESVAEFVAGDELLSGLSKGVKLVALARKYPIVAKTLNLATQHPWLAKMILEGTKGAIVGGTVGGLKGSQSDQGVAGAEKGAAIGGAVGAAGGFVSEAMSRLRVNPFRQMLEGKNIAQEPAEAAARSAVQQGVAQVGLQTAQPSSLRTIVEEPITAVNGLKKQIYGQVDQAAGTDLKTLYDKLDAINDKIDLEASGSPEEARLEAQRTSQMQTIEDAKQAARAKGVDVDSLLAKGDALHTKEMALRDVQKAFFKNPNLIEGNTALGTPETINIDSAVKILQRLEDNTKFGAPRLEQAFGKDGAHEMLREMYAAQRAGLKAMQVQRLAKWLGGIVGAATVGGAAVEGIKHLAQP